MTEPRQNGPIVSVVTVVKNDRPKIQDTIESVLKKKDNRVEYIVVDGGSTDGTLEIIGRYSRHIDRLVSEPDRGIYDAMNKGVRLASGAYLLFINSGDLLYGPCDVEELLALLSVEGPDIVYGNVLKQYENGFSKVEVPPSFEKPLYSTICHQGIIMRTALLRELPFNTRYKYDADFDQLIRLQKRGKVKSRYIDRIVSVYDDGGVTANRFSAIAEKRKVLRTYYSRVPLSIHLKDVKRGIDILIGKLFGTAFHNRLVAVKNMLSRRRNRRNRPNRINRKRGTG